MAKVTKKAPKVVEEAIEEVLTDEIVEDIVASDEASVPTAPAVVYGDEFSYTIKAGKGTFPNMSDSDVMQFVDATLGKVDKIEIIRK